MTTELKIKLEITDKQRKLLSEACDTQVAKANRGYNNAPNDMLREVYKVMVQDAEEIRSLITNAK